ncbi:MAG: hypothetical protein LBS86_05030 [Treponema sp.]|jgi:hypothetical protein|nr:hypothetical protein [Treponema sp.]
MDFSQIMAIAAAIVPSVAYVVTTMVMTKRNREDFLRLEARMEVRMDAFERRLTALETDVAVIKALCLERYRPPAP